MPKVSWACMMAEHPKSHLIVGTTARLRVDERAAREDASRRAEALGRLARALEFRGKFAVTPVPGQRGMEIHCAIERQTDADRLAQAVRAGVVGKFPGWASQRGFVFDNRMLTAIEDALAQADNGR